MSEEHASGDPGTPGAQARTATGEDAPPAGVQERIELRDGLGELDPAAWDALTGGHQPFLRHAFLEGLERHECLGRQFGWFPQHVLIFHDDTLVAAAPAYAKTNNYGEFVFDFAWEGAWQRQGLNYYPKLVVAVPYTPATGPRLLVHPQAPDPERLRRQLLRALVTRGRELEASGVHVLFPDESDRRALAPLGLPERMGCQYHWTNAPEDGGYADFDAFLAALSSKKRKNIKRERRRVAEAGIRFRTVTGATGSPEDWARFHRFYVDTFEKHMGIPTLTEAFFVETAAALGDQVVLFEACRPTGDDESEPESHGERGETIAAALCYRSGDTLYGRFWGATEDLDALHFETCYYQGIEFCIREGLTRFEPGAQGEHKIPRGFLPTPTWSIHTILTPGFEQPVRDFCEREAAMMREHCERLHAHSPFRQGESGDGQP